jgi:hypothetical protein
VRAGFSAGPQAQVIDEAGGDSGFCFGEAEDGAASGGTVVQDNVFAEEGGLLDELASGERQANG